MNFLHIDILHKPEHEAFVRSLADKMGKVYVCPPKPLLILQENLEDYLEAEDVDMIFISCPNTARDVQKWLSLCRNIRVPYIFMTSTMLKVKPIQRILIPVTMLEEEVYKAQILSHVGRYTEAKLILLKAHDYGSHAQRNVNKIITSLEFFSLSAEVIEARKDSLNLHRELTDRQREFLSDLIFVTASREYGLDDLLFGPQERHIIRRSQVPIMLINPRGDLFSLCD